MTLTTLALTFVLSAVVIVAAGTVLARSGDVIAARTGLGRLWVGSVFLALATSLPEITTDIAAVRLGAPDLAAGDLFGSTMANMLILALISLVPAGREIFQKATLDHVLHASLAVVMTCVAAITMLVRPAVSVLRVGPASLLLVAMYAVGSRAAYRHGTLARHAAERVEMSGLAADTPEGVGPAVAPPTLRRASIAFAGSSLVTQVSAPQLARAAEGIAILTGVGTTFLGTWLVGLTTSLPELVTSLAAVRLRAYDLAVGNLFGSNALNMMIFLALANAVEPLRAHADVVLPEAQGRGVVGFLRRRLTDGVADVEPRRWQVVLGTYDDRTRRRSPRPT